MSLPPGEMVPFRRNIGNGAVSVRCKSTTKKPHKIMKSVEFFDGFLHLKTKNNIFSIFLFLALCLAFVLRLIRQPRLFK